MRRSTLLGFLLAAATFVAMRRICTHEFTNWDDDKTLHHNPRMNPPSFRSVLWYWEWGTKNATSDPSSLRRSVASSLPLPHTEMDIYMPVTQAAWAALASIAYMDTPDDQGIHLNPWIFHSASLVVHAATALLVFAILLRLFRSDVAAALAGAMLFALHPVQVEAVAWASGMKDLLCGMFGMLAVWQYVQYASAPRGNREEGSGFRVQGSGENSGISLNPHYALATLAFILALLSKPAGMVIPLLAGILDLLLLRRPLRRVMAALSPWLVLSVLCALIARLVQPATGVAVTAWWTRPFIAADAIAFYLYKLLLPLRLAPDYGHRPVVVMSHWWFWVVWLIPATLALAFWRLRRRSPELLTSALLLLAGVAPMLGLTPFLFQFYSTTADHYLYLAMLGPATALAWAVRHFRSRVFAGVVATWLAVLAILSMHQAGYWQDSLTLWRHTVDVSPTSFVAPMNLGNALARSGRMADAGDYYRRSVAINGDFPLARENLALYLAWRGRPDEAIDQMREALRLTDAYPPRIRPDNSAKHYSLGVKLIERGRSVDAASELELSLKQRPDNPEAARALATAHDKARQPATRPSP